MDRDSLERRLTEAGYSETAALALGATLRPEALDATIAAPTPSTRPRALPRLSIDLRDSIPGTANAGTPKMLDGADLEVVGLLGEGGMGRVLLARQHSLQRDVAVKTARELASAPAALAILAEGAINGRLEHPSIMPVHALGVDVAGRPAIVMKRVEGVAWSELAEDPSHPGWEGWDGDADDRLPGHLAIFGQVCNAVRYAHSRGVVHRDIKLDNVLIGRFGDVYLADWGVAAEMGTATPQLCGTPGYMAPEMVDGRAIDERTDVYLLGATLHEILTGQLRHAGASAVEALLRARESPPADYGEHVPPELGRLMNQACHVEPVERFADAGALREAVQDYLTHREAGAMADAGVERVARLEALLEEGARDESGLATIERTIAEARFGLEQSLERWPENARAAEARDRLMTIIEARRARAAELERTARERDPTVSVGARAAALLLFGIFGTTLTVFALMSSADPPPWALIFYPSAVLVATAVGVLLLRRRIMTTDYNRHFVYGLLLLLVILVGMRATGVWMGDTIDEHIVRDSWVMVAGFGLMGIALARWVFWVAAAYVLSVVLCIAMPAHSFQIFLAITTVVTFGAAYGQWRASREGA